MTRPNNFNDKVENAVVKVETIPIVLATRFGPWLTPIPPAYFVAVELVKYSSLPFNWLLAGSIIASYIVFASWIFVLLRLLDDRHLPKINGFVYLIIREDDIYKIGRTIDIDNRLDELKRDYDMRFEVIQAWPSSDYIRDEKKALALSSGNMWIEDRRKELRRFDKDGLAQFTKDFSKYMRGA